MVKLLTILLLVLFNTYYSYSDSKDETLVKMYLSKYLNVKLDNNGLINTDTSVYRIYKTMSLNDTNGVKHLLTILEDTKPQDVCQPCPVNVLILEWSIKRELDSVIKYSKLSINSSGTFGQIDGIFQYKLLNNIPILLYHDVRVEDGKGIFKFHNTYVISRGFLVDILYNSFESNEESRVVHKNNIIDYKSSFLFDQETGTINVKKSGIRYDSIIYEEVVYKLYGDTLFRCLTNHSKKGFEYKGLTIKIIDNDEKTISMNDVRSGQITCSESVPIDRIEFIPNKSFNKENEVRCKLICINDDGDTSNYTLLETKFFYININKRKSFTLPLTPWVFYERGFYRLTIEIRDIDEQSVSNEDDEVQRKVITLLDVFYYKTYD
jgi:hypothetical protein